MDKHDQKGRTMKKHLFYDKKNDILSIHKGFDKDEHFKGNVDRGDLVLDLSTKGSVKGIEIINASKFLGPFNIQEEMLHHLTDADFTTEIKNESILLTITLRVAKEDAIPAKILIPLEPLVVA